MRQRRLSDGEDMIADVLVLLTVALFATAVIASFAYLVLVDILAWPTAALGLSLRTNTWTHPGPFRMHLTSRALQAIGRAG